LDFGFGGDFGFKAIKIILQGQSQNFQDKAEKTSKKFPTKPNQKNLLGVGGRGFPRKGCQIKKKKQGPQRGGGGFIEGARVLGHKPAP